MSFVKIATVSEVPIGTMKYVEVGGKELCIVNVSDKFYVIGERCGHENASLSRGKLDGTTVICPMHSSKFDVITGKKLSGPVLELDGIAEKFSGCPENVRKEMGEMFKGIAAAQSLIKTYDLPVYEVKVDGNDLLVKL